MSAEYIGRPWRARFLRAPKIALVIARHPSFVSLYELANVTLGLKTGADKFFLVSPDTENRRQQIRFGPSGSAVNVRVCGLDGWQGEIAAKDLLPAIRNPHELFIGQERVFSIPARTPALYLYPRDRAPGADLPNYIKVAEREGINRGELVRSNASSKRWYRQVRAVVQPRWVMPYNSAYDYGSWDNRVRAVINGRFVGVEPRENVDPDLLGAALNSTWVMATRLLEGVTTGVEGAFDVGPPAARLMAVPDVRRMTGEAVADIQAILEELRQDDRMPSAPTRDAHVESTRHQLDLAILQALGWSKGEAASLTSRLYESYARWRTAVEHVEMTMRKNRSNMARSGQGRAESPTDMVARTVWAEIASELRLFPHDCLNHDVALEEIDVARNLKAGTQEPLFDSGRVTSSDGNVIDLGSWSRVRYAAMLLEIGFEPPLSIPVDPIKAGTIVDAFDNEVNKFRAMTAARVSKHVALEEVEQVVRAIRRLWFRASRTVGMKSVTP